MPLARIDAASSSSFASRKTVRGWSGFGSRRSRSTSISTSPCSTVAVPEEKSALSPLPSAFLVICQNLLGQIQVTVRTPTFHIVEQDRLAVARRLGEPHVARDRRLEDLRSEKIAQVGHHLIREVRSLVEHRQEKPLDCERGVEAA